MDTTIKQNGHQISHKRSNPPMWYGSKIKNSQERSQTMTSRTANKGSLSRFGTSLSMLMGMHRRTGYGSEQSKGSKKENEKAENTYKLKPNTGEIFETKKVEEIIEETLKVHLDDVQYHPSTAKELSCRIANTIERKVKLLNMPRFKIVCHVILGENKDQGLEFASRCLWDSNYDNWACATYEHETICATASVYGIYFE